MSSALIFVPSVRQSLCLVALRYSGALHDRRRHLLLPSENLPRFLTREA